MNDSLFIALQRLTPQHALSRAAGWLANCEVPLVKDTFIRWFVKRYTVNLTEAEYSTPQEYPSFNAFFTRALCPGSRPIAPGAENVACPADGTVSQLGQIKDGRLFQAKGYSFTANELLGNDPEAAALYDSGEFATIYLSPRDYHRVHMPVEGTLRKMVHVPGRLFSVNQVTTEQLPRLFVRNERVVCHFSTDRGPMVLVLVGAMIVASIETVWAGLVTPIRRTVRTTEYSAEQTVTLAKGDEMGRFLLGSTVIMLFPKNTVQWQKGLCANTKVRMGEAIAHRN